MLWQKHGNDAHRRVTEDRSRSGALESPAHVGELEAYSTAIYEVFTSLPWDPEPNSRGRHFGDDDGGHS